MGIAGFVSQADEALNARRVFGDPIERNGLTVIPVARIAGGGGGAEGRIAAEGAEGAAGPERVTGGLSGGVGLFAQPAGVYVVKDDAVRWIPAVDVNRMLRNFSFVAVVLLLVVRSIAKAQAKVALQRAREVAT